MCAHRMRAVRTEIEDDLVNLRRIGEYAKTIRCDVRFNRDRSRQCRAQETTRLVDDHGEVDGTMLRIGGLASEGENLLHQLTRPQARATRFHEKRSEEHHA